MLRTFLLLVITTQTFAQQSLSDARTMAMSNSCVALQSPFALINKASTVNQKQSFFQLSAVNRYSLSELNSCFVSYSGKINSNNSVVLSIFKTLNKSFTEQFAEVSCSKRLATKFSAAVSMKYYQWKLNDSHYENSQSFIPEISLLVSALPSLNLGVIIRNPVRSRMNANEMKKLPAEIISGISVAVSNKISLSCSATANSTYPTSVQTGIEYIYAPQFIVRAGYNTFPVSQSFGCEFILSSFSTAVAIESNPQLGISSSISLTFAL
jgi:hypothetical protein